MTSMRKSNRTMLASIVALSLCFVLLLGATWAWFQDTVVNSGNSIETGKYGFAVKLEVLGEDNAMWNDVIVDISGFTGDAAASVRFDFFDVTEESIDVAYQAFFSGKDDAIAYAAADDATLGCRYFTYTAGVTNAHKNPTIEDVSLNS